MRIGLGILAGCLVGLAAWFVAGPLILLSAFEPPNKSNWGLVHGRLVDSRTKQPIAGASVSGESHVPLQLISDRDDTRSNTNGEFQLRVPPRRDAWVTVRAKGYASLGFQTNWCVPNPLELVPETAREKDLIVHEVDFPPEMHRDGFQLDLERGRVVEGGDYDVFVRLDQADTSTVLAEAGPGRSLRVEERHGCIPAYSMPENLVMVPEAGYVRVARVPRRSKSLLCIVRRDRGPRYGIMGFNPAWWFPSEGLFRYTRFEVAYNRAGGRGFLGANEMIFQ